MGLIGKLGGLLVRNGVLASSTNCCCGCPPNQQCGPNCCNANEQCCESGPPGSEGPAPKCCPDDEHCCVGVSQIICCEEPEYCCGLDNEEFPLICCTEEAPCCGGEACCEHVCCDGACCPPEHKCVDGECEQCPEGTSLGCGENCCPDEVGWGCCAGECCPPQHNCVNGECVPICPPERVCGEACCPEGQVCIDGTCVEPCEYEGCPECSWPANVYEEFEPQGTCEQAPQLASNRNRIDGGGKHDAGGPFGAVAGGWTFWAWKTENGYPNRLLPESCEIRWILDTYNEVCQGSFPDDPTVYCVQKTHYRWRLFQPRKIAGECTLVDITAEAINDQPLAEGYPCCTILQGVLCNGVNDPSIDTRCDDCEGFAPEGPEPYRYLEDPVMECDP